MNSKPSEQTTEFRSESIEASENRANSDNPESVIRSESAACSTPDPESESNSKSGPKRKSGFLKKLRAMEAHPLPFSLGMGFILYFIVEALSRHSPVSAVEYLIDSPLVFLYNWIIVSAVFSLYSLFRKREFALILLSLLWLALGIINCVLLCFRTTPFNFMDLRTFKDVMSIMTVYFTVPKLILILVSIVVFLAFMVICFIKTPKVRVKYLRSVISVILLWAALAGSTYLAIANEIVATTFHNIQDAYLDYGFAYCYSTSVVNRGIDKPVGYSEASMKSLSRHINSVAESKEDQTVKVSDHATEETPNIIFLQMESFFDVNHLMGVTFSENPVPVFTELRKNYTSGILTTPSFGAGTSNTEFEVLTGMSMEHFGPGEYPYTTILRKTTGESVAYDLKESGYSTHAIHDHTGKFYGRYLVYPNLGFDSFTSVEYMQNIVRNPLNWVEDSILQGEITKALDSTEEQDFVFAVSVQGHGKYPTEVIDETQTITVEGFNEDEAVGFEYYVNQINRMDAFLGDLIEELEASDEPTVLMIYGDHLPKFTITDEDLDNGNVFQTEYVIWSNYELPVEDENITTYQLYSKVLELVGIHNGTMTKLNQYCNREPLYKTYMSELQYDILYGSNYVNGGENPYEQTDMQMGIDPISITNVYKHEQSICVTGVNFTYASKIFINGKEHKTRFEDINHIYCDNSDVLKDGDIIEVIQMSSKKTQLSTTGQYIWTEACGLTPYEDSKDSN